MKSLQNWQKKIVYALPFLLFLAMAWFLMRGLFNDPQYVPSAYIGKPLPSFSLPNLLEPTDVVTEERFTGSPALLNVWATWCPSCRVEHDELVRLAKEEGIVIYGLNYKDEPDAAKAYLDHLGNPFLLSVSDIEGRFGFDLGVYGAPETYIIDSQANIHYRLVGILDQEKWENELKPILENLK